MMAFSQILNINSPNEFALDEDQAANETAQDEVFVSILSIFENGEQSPIECETLKKVSSGVLFLFVASLLTNGRLLFVLTCTKQLKTLMNTFVTALTILNLIGTICQLPIIIISNYMCR